MGLALGSPMGLGLLMGIWGDGVQETWSLHEALAQLRSQAAQTAAAVSPSPPRDSASPKAMRPGLQERDVAWLWLQQSLQAQGLKLESLHPQPLQNGVLPSQLAQVRLSGDWGDWLSVWQQMAMHTPWWQWEQWQVLPMPIPGQVQVQARLRLWLQADPAGVLPVRAWPAWGRAPRASAPVPVFAVASAATTAPSPQAPAVSASEPAWRLWGVWTQAGDRRVVLGRGSEWVALSEGQAWPAQGVRVLHIGLQGVRLQGPGAEPMRQLSWEESP